MPASKDYSEAALARLLETAASELEIELEPSQLGQLAGHFSLLLRWNSKINLTSVRQPEAIARRHFQESLFLTTIVPDPGGTVVDIGSGAGFPGLPLKVAWPTAEFVLLEPNQKKAAFLMEVIRAANLKKIGVCTDRLEEYVENVSSEGAQLVTVRAMKPSQEFVAQAASLLASEGSLALFLGEDDASVLTQRGGLQWREPMPIPHSERRVILIGARADPSLR